MGTPVPDSKPFVQAACVCEKVLIEPDNVASLIRIVDTYTLAIPSEQLANVQVATNLTAFVSLKSGPVIGDFEVGLRLHPPDGEGKEQPVRRWPVEFRGAETGVNLRIEFTLQEPTLGLYWFDVLWGDEVLTRIPFRLKAGPSESTAREAVSSESTKN